MSAAAPWHHPALLFPFWVCQERERAEGSQKKKVGTVRSLSLSPSDFSIHRTRIKAQTTDLLCIIAVTAINQQETMHTLRRWRLEICAPTTSTLSLL